MNRIRRQLSQSALALAALGMSRDTAQELLIADDISGLNSMPIRQVLRPTSSAMLAKMLERSAGPVCIGGARYSSGGQTLLPNAIHIDTSMLNGVLALDVANATVRVQAGIRWRDLQSIIDPFDLSVAIMQSYANFSIGGSVSVNCHGRYVGHGALIHSIRALQLLSADGQLLELSRTQRPDIFAAVVGGYGGLGVITEVELTLARNHAIQRQAIALSLAEYPTYFQTAVLANPKAVLHNADLLPPDFEQPIATTWFQSDAALTETARLRPANQDYGRDQTLSWAATELPVDRYVQDYRKQEMLSQQPVVMRNFEASLDAKSLEPRTRYFSTFLLQEYFIPCAAFFDFHRALCQILKANEANILNISIRHAKANNESLLTWCKQEVFSFVLYYKQRATAAADIAAQAWTLQLIDAALAVGGSYYLPYRLHASQPQFERAYTLADRMRAVKQQIDPNNRFSNQLWQKYLLR